MADVTDAAFRRVIAKYGKPDVIWNEFISVDGLLHPKGRENLMLDLKYDESERPIVAQIFGNDPAKFRDAAALLSDHGFDGIDVNFGCPAKVISRQCAGASLIDDPKRAMEIMRATKEGAGDVPVSVKTRLGHKSDVLEEWLPVLLETEPVAITIHARTAKEMSKVPARWERIARAREIMEERGSKALLIGNGDVRDLVDGRERALKYGADGVMLGRAVFGDPWCFNTDIKREEVAPKERMRVLLEHSRLFDELVSHKSFAVMRKHFKAYTLGIPDVHALREALMETQNADDVEGVLGRFRML